MPAADGALEGEVDLMVLEYLAHAGYERAASALKVQIKERRAGKKSSWRPVGKDVRAHVKTRMMKALDRGERDEVRKHGGAD